VWRVAGQLQWLPGLLPIITGARGGVRTNDMWTGIIPALGIALCILIIVPLLLDLFEKSLRGDTIPAMEPEGYAVLGALIY